MDRTCQIEAIKCNVVGEHGDSQFPVWSRLAIAGQPMEEYCENVGLAWGEREKNMLYNYVRDMGAHIIAANVDRAYLVVSLYFPEIKLPFLDRILVTCGVYGIPATIVLSKKDLYQNIAQDGIDAFHAIYEGAGYPVIDTSVITGEGIDTLRESCRGKVNLFSGESGVGKSSLIKALDPALDPKIGQISTAHLQGKHTTSLYEMYPLASGGYVIDSPGLRGFGLVDLEKEEIGKYFPEMLRASEGCRFTPCTHTHEPGCAVKAAVDAGTISAQRYNSYLGMLEEDQKFR